ncbi:asparagine synthase (glutamine-hydrolyzing) [Hydrogenovibrio sp. JE_KL2]|uniref:asparagine synthase (glutamine-hydrolyzing) n=1 Tax=Hydrogenovibrio sp. JE_KL2 TaxID=2651188 RepID=UPI00128BA8C2|nr:asparagine synthase (glutamine-hydrolyzing) [Hydrogenovibrio sp. JE_KL2]MPQ75469.1 asparagine synthase (glutamine-hydrolyzing) [Hydrogenovibrio sp. JE_KL2]
MCGIAGFIGQYPQPIEQLKNMAEAILHRGPDDQGVWFDKEHKVGLSHARLSILDLSSAGHQPMSSASERFVIVFNGEIYNHNQLRTELDVLETRQWNGHSDTETLLAAIEQWGLEATLKKATGMFAVALWDKQKKVLSIARDRMGEKPLYYGWIDGKFVFASELKAIKKVPGFTHAVDRNSLAVFLRYNSIPAPYSIYKDIYKLEPGCIASICHGERSVEKSYYWSLSNVVESGKSAMFMGSSKEAVDQLELVLMNAVALQMDADVPLGAFLSGGVDSSTIVALMQSQSETKVKTFSIGFDVELFNEAEYAKAVAKHLGTEHYEMYASSHDALNVIPSLPEIYDEPFADSSQIPTYLVSKIAKEKVTVSLSGDAGDELFAGYNRYSFSNELWNKISWLPIPMRNLAKKAITSASPEAWSKAASFFIKSKGGHWGDKLYKGASILDCKNLDELYLRLVSQIDHPEEWLVEATEYPTALTQNKSAFNYLSPIERMMVYDMLGYLPTDILTKVDRAAMSVSLETRVPLLDPNVIQYAVSLPMDFKIREGVSKWVLREVLYKHVPKELIERPKMGFGVPLAEWLRGPLRDWGECLLDEQRLSNEGYFNVSIVRDKWMEHLSGRRNWHHQLWNVLMFQAWLEQNK